MVTGFVLTKIPSVWCFKTWKDDFDGNLLRDDLGSKTARKLVRKWADAHRQELMEDWERARNDERIEPIAPLE